MSSAGCGLIQTSTDRAHGPAVLLGERFESGIIRNLMFYFHGSRERMALHGLKRQRLTMLPLYLIRRISRVIGTTTVVIAEIVITIDSRVHDKWSFELLHCGEDFHGSHSRELTLTLSGNSTTT